MSASQAVPRRRNLALLWLIGIAALLALGLTSGDFRSLFADALKQVTPLSVLATLPGQVAASLLCAAALLTLRPGVGFIGSLNSRLLRDAGDNLLVFMPGLGEVIGARALVLAGGRTRAAVTASALDKFAETLAQVPYIALAAVVLLQGWNGALPDLPAPASIALAMAASVVGLALVWRFARSRQGLAGKLAARVRAEFALLAGEMRLQKAGLPLSTGLHFLAWVMGGLQIWMAARALGYDIGPYESIAIESAAYAGRAILFFVPAGLVTQEAGLVAAGLVFGLTPAQSLALALVLRLRDVVFGLPLLAWPLYEYRHARRKGAAALH